MKKRIFLIAVIVMTAATTTVFAQRGRMGNCPQGYNGAGPGPGPNPEMRAYFQDNVLPVLVSEREALDNQLSQADKTRIDEIRTEMKSMRESMWAQRAEMRNSDERPSLEQRKEMREHRNKMHDLMDEITGMSLKYDSEISASLEALRDQAGTWCNNRQGRNNGNFKRGYNCPGNMRGAGNRGFGGRGQGMGRGPGMGRGHGMGMGPRGWMTPEGFLLFDPANPMPFVDDNAFSPDDSQINLFPNPADNSVQISANLDSNADVTIELIDKDGQVVITRSQRNAGAGLFTETLNLEDLDTGIYFVKLNTGSKKYVERLVVKK